MALEQEFQKRAGETIENYLRILNGAFPNGQSLADTWKYEHEDGFMYGLIIGQLDRLIVGYFRGIYDRAPTLLLVGGNDEPVISMNQEAYDKLRLLKADEKA